MPTTGHLWFDIIIVIWAALIIALIALTLKGS
jgi:hypothetical protein